MLKTPKALAAVDEMLESVHPVIAARANPARRPDVLYHFTDVAGLIGIITGKSLWGSLATSLNDATEVVYAADRTCRLCKEGIPGIDPSFLKRVREFIGSRQWLPEYRVDIEAYVVSFCARADLALQWLHYGRSGSGAAIGLASALEVKPFDLVPVLYDPDLQDRLLATILDTVFKMYSKHVKSIDAAERDEFDAVAPHIAAQYVWAVGAQLKDPAFSGEEEWRLMTLEMVNPRIPKDVGVPLQTHFRTVATRLVPYKVYALEHERLREIILGSTVSMEPTDPAFSTLFRECTRREIPVTRSLVKVRQ